MNKALFICFEGIDGAGKSSASIWFFEQLKAAGLDVIRTREPGGTPLAERVRELTLWGIPNMDEDFPDWAEALMYNASRSIHLHNLILPRLRSGTTVITDRFCDSTYAHQGGGRGLNIDHLKKVHEVAHGNVKPDITFLFDGSPELFKARMEGRNPDRLERNPIEFQHRSRQVHLDLVAEAPDRYVVIDAEQSEQAVQAQLMPHVMRLVSELRKRPTAAI